MPKHVLIVEDDFQHGARVQTELQRHGFTVSIARSSQDAMCLLRRASFDLAILDLFVDDGPTTQLSNYMRMRHPGLPIISLTGSNMFPDGCHADVLSADYLLRKPVRSGELGAIAQYLTDQLTARTAAH